MEELQALLRQAQDGDVDAYGQLVRRFQDMAVGYAYTVLGDFHLAEDAAQEAFIEAYHNLCKVYGPRAFPAWLRQIIFRQCQRQRRDKWGASVILGIEDGLVSEQPNPEAVVARREMQYRLRCAIADLPEHQRQVIALFYVSEYSHKEIAAFLDASVNTVKKRLYDARRRLKERLLIMVQEDLREKRPSKDERFVDKVLQLIAPDEKEHSEGIYKLLERPNHPLTLQWRQGRMSQSHLDWMTSRIGCLDGEVVSVFGVYDISVRIGTARVRTAGINLDATHPDYQGRAQELKEKTALASIEAMRAQGYDLSITFGEEVFFSGLGYVFAWRELGWDVDTDELTSEPPDFELHDFTPDHREDLAELYNRENELITGTAVKPTYWHNKHPSQFQGWFWTNSKGKPVGYISGGAGIKFHLDLDYQVDLDRGEITDALRHQINEGFKGIRGPLSPYAVCAVQVEGNRWLIVDGKGTQRKQRRHLVVNAGDKLNVYLRERSLFWVDESVGDPEQRIQVLGKLARQFYCDAVYFDRLPYKSVLGKRLRQMHSCQIQPDSWGGLRGSRAYVIRIINLRSLFEKLTNELSRRLRKSPLAEWSGNLIISSGEEEIMLVIDRSDVKVKSGGTAENSIRGGQEIAQLIVGTETADEIVEMNQIRLSGKAQQLIEVLFPAQYPQMENQAL
ncbi:MAG: sigma-70 family RNA polymerase sigma factor [Gemmatimonadetes bacterium]|nr:sigma-70 family RNA polymerase sigma factor [Gemmatimonadota bacterium]